MLLVAVEAVLVLWVVMHQSLEAVEMVAQEQQAQFQVHL
jgi:hypothetical protein